MVGKNNELKFIRKNHSVNPLFFYISHSKLKFAFIIFVYFWQNIEGEEDE